MALVQGFAVGDRQIELADLLQDDLERALGPLQHAREGGVEVHAARLQKAGGDERLDQPLLGEVGVVPAGEEVAAVPLALTVPDQHERVIAIFLRGHAVRLQL